MKVNRNRFYIIDKITGIMSDTTAGRGYETWLNARADVLRVPLDNPVVRAGGYLIRHKICKEEK